MNGVFVDTCTFINFAVVGRLDLLADTLDGRGLWTDAIRMEVFDAAQTRSSLETVSTWMPPPIVIDDVQAIGSVLRLRRAVSRDPSDPTDSYGEAQMLHLMLNEAAYEGGTLLSDDRSAVNFAGKRGLKIAMSADLVSESYHKELIPCPDAYELLEAMRDAPEKRGVVVPPSHWDVCP